MYPGNHLNESHGGNSSPVMLTLQVRNPVVVTCFICAVTCQSPQCACMLPFQDLRDENSGIQARIARKPQYKCPKCSYTSLRKKCVTAHIKNRNHWAGAHPNGTPKVDQVYSYQNQSLGSSYNMGGRIRNGLAKGRSERRAKGKLQQKNADE